MKNIFFGNFSSGAKAEAIRSVFESFETVQKFKLMMDTKTGPSPGFALVEMTETEARAAPAASEDGIVGGQAPEGRDGRPKRNRRPSPGTGTPDGSPPQQ